MLYFLSGILGICGVPETLDWAQVGMVGGIEPEGAAKLFRARWGAPNFFYKLSRKSDPGLQASRFCAM